MVRDFGTTFVCTDVVPWAEPPKPCNDSRSRIPDGQRLSGGGNLVFEGEAIAEPSSRTFFPDPEVDDTFHFIK
jgi:hypothetical protein